MTEFGDFKNKSVLITGGTRGIGLACGLAFARQGARAILTHRWGSADEDALRGQFAALGAAEPLIVEADVARDEDTAALLERIKQDHDRVDVFISNVCVVVRGEGPLQHSRRALYKSLEYSSWPFVSYLHAIKKAFGRYPTHAVAMSSDGPDTHYPAYDFVAVAKAVLETFVRYMNTHLVKDGCRVNALRTRQVMTESYAAMFGPEQVALGPQLRGVRVHRGRGRRHHAGAVQRDVRRDGRAGGDARPRGGVRRQHRDAGAAPGRGGAMTWRC
jgi:NAD(P)-dependent dehydrogenase (short-subunit alcohol dehydrogenase family)